jgi:hypothetical protein
MAGRVFLQEANMSGASSIKAGEAYVIISAKLDQLRAAASVPDCFKRAVRQELELLDLECRET